MCAGDCIARWRCARRYICSCKYTAFRMTSTLHPMLVLNGASTESFLFISLFLCSTKLHGNAFLSAVFFAFKLKISVKETFFLQSMRIIQDNSLSLRAFNIYYTRWKTQFQWYIDGWTDLFPDGSEPSGADGRKALSFGFSLGHNVTFIAGHWGQ